MIYNSKNLFFNSESQLCYAFITGVHSVAICFSAYGYTLIGAPNKCIFCKGYTKECSKIMLLCSSDLK